MTAEQSAHKGRKNISVKSAIGIFLLFIAAKTAMIPYEDPRYTIAAMNALSGGIAQCDSKEAPRNKEYPYDAIMVLGGGSVRIGPGIYEPSEVTITRLKATAIAYKERKSDRIFIMSGKMSPGEELVELKRLQYEYSQLPGYDRPIPDEAITVESKSLTTASNMDAIAKIVKEFGLKDILMITDDSHMRRAKLLMCDRLSGSSAIAEDIIKDYSSSTKELMHAIVISKGMTDAEKREVTNLTFHWVVKPGFLI